jgi:hypothetical protein
MQHDRLGRRLARFPELVSVESGILHLHFVGQRIDKQMPLNPIEVGGPPDHSSE